MANWIIIQNKLINLNTIESIRRSDCGYKLILLPIALPSDQNSYTFRFQTRELAHDAIQQIIQYLPSVQEIKGGIICQLKSLIS